LAAAADRELGGLTRPRLSIFEIVWWTAPVLAYLCFPDRRLLLSQIFVHGLFALSMDLLLGYAGIVSLGQAAFFGTGAYTAGLLAQRGWTEPLSGLLAATLVCVGLGYAVGALLTRATELGRLMITLGIGLLFWEGANRASALTGGVDGLSDMQAGRLFGRFSFGLDGSTAAIYSFLVLGLVFLLARRMVQAPFGLTLRGLRENTRRLPAIGVNVAGRQRAIFACAAGIAGTAGALLAQTTQFVGIDTLGLPRSAEVLIMVVLGGPGRLYGALVGATAFLLAQDLLSGLSPEYWQFWLGALLVVVVLLARGGRSGVLGAAERLWQLVQRRTWRPRSAR
jgi:branched-chain amino acid transport system permease protein